MNNNNPTPNRLQLNFGFTDRNNNGNYAADSGRAYPTTPSTFPQPVFPNQSGQQEVWGTQQPTNGHAAPGYFAAAYQQGTQQGGYTQQQGNLQAPSTAYRAPQYNDSTNGLVHQFSHQNLGGGRSASPYGRQPSPAQRPRTAGATGQQQYGGYLNAPIPGAPRQPSLYDEEPPSKTPEKYSENVLRQAKVSVGLVNTFFKDSVQRARERNQR
jgi:protein-serine/threonine kinase